MFFTFIYKSEGDVFIFIVSARTLKNVCVHGVESSIFVCAWLGVPVGVWICRILSEHIQPVNPSTNIQTHTAHIQQIILNDQLISTTSKLTTTKNMDGFSIADEQAINKIADLMFISSLSV